MAVQSTRSKAPIQGIIAGVLVAIIGGLIVGAVSYLVSQIGYVVFFFPGVMGFIIGIILGKVLYATHMRHLVIAGCLGLLMGIVTYGTYHVGRYIKFLEDYPDDAYQQMILDGTFNTRDEAETAIPLDEFPVYLESLLVETYGQGGFIGYLMLEADRGEDVVRAAGDRLGELDINLDGSTLGIYWGIELLMIMIIPALYAIGKITEPYCEDTGAWRETKTVGFVDTDDHNAFMQAIEQKNFAHAHQYIQEDVEQVSMIVYASRCSATSPEAILQITQGIGRDVDTLLDGTISGTDYEALTGTSLL